MKSNIAASRFRGWRDRWAYHALSDILNERRSLTARTAMRFEAALNVPADSLMRLQLKYNLHMAQTDKKLRDSLDKIRKAAAML